ncbi:MAG: molybdenum cofactor sulfurase [Chloroflexi bacterium RBG_13_53_26]|nr:MAG: molybdenum cofactor sulfurase [Chloroflexi bacterium RBG_13_53_26]
MAEILAVCRSKDKGTRKDVVESVTVKEGYGVVDDAHADCCTHRQVSLLAKESIDKMVKIGLQVGPGDFAENFTTRGIVLTSLAIGSQLSLGEEVIIEVTQIGKDCHTGCAIFREVGRCIMPKEGVFARVVHGGLVRHGDTIELKGQSNNSSNG